MIGSGTGSGSDSGSGSGSGSGPECRATAVVEGACSSSPGTPGTSPENGSEQRFRVTSAEAHKPRYSTEGGVMPPRGVAKGSKRARQYEHIKEGLEKRGRSEGVAEEIAART